MAQQGLDRLQVRTVLEQVGGEGVAQRVTGYTPHNPRRFGGPLHLPLQRRRVDVVPHAPRALAHVGLLQRGHSQDLLLQLSQNVGGQDGRPILAPLAVPYDDPSSRDVEILDPQLCGLRDPQPAAVHQPGHQAVGLAHLVERLVLRRSGERGLDGEEGQELADVSGVESRWGLEAVELDEADDPAGIGFLGAGRVVEPPQLVADSLHQLLGHYCCLRWVGCERERERVFGAKVEVLRFSQRNMHRRSSAIGRRRYAGYPACTAGYAAKLGQIAPLLARNGPSGYRTLCRVSRDAQGGFWRKAGGYGAMVCSL